MRTGTKALVGAAGGLLAAWVGWGAYVGRVTERVPYETVERFEGVDGRRPSARRTESDGVEIRRYPRTVLAETTADDEGVAFDRLFRYISGENEGGDEVAMTAPVSTRGPKLSMTTPVPRRYPEFDEISMTAPVRTTPEDGGVTMAFYLPAEYGPGDAPIPTNPAVRLAVEPARTLAVKRFSWSATEGRVERYRRELLDALAARNVEPRTRPILFQYNDPWTPPFMRRNEVAVEVDWE